MFWFFFKSSLFLHFLPSLSVHLLKSLRQGGAHQISIVDLLMPRSGLQRQRFHTQDEREMNTEDAGGDMGPWPGQPLPLWPLHCTGLGSERSRGGGAQIEVSHLYNNSHPSLPPKMAEHRLVFSYLIVNHRVLLISDEAQTFACLLELAGQESRCSMRPKLNFSPFQWRPFFFLPSPLFLQGLGPFETSPDA